MKRKLGVFLKLSGSERGLLLRAWWLLLGVDWGLRLLPFRRLQRLLARGLPPPQTVTLGGYEDAWRTWRWVDAAARHHLYPMTCLRRSLALQRLLRTQGLEAELKIGVRKEEGRLQAHAWIEVQGRVVGEREAVSEQYQALVGGTRQA